MTNSTKKIIIIIVIVLALVLAGLVGYAVYRAVNDQQTENSINPSTATQSSAIKESLVEKIGKHYYDAMIKILVSSFSTNKDSLVYRESSYVNDGDTQSFLIDDMSKKHTYTVSILPIQGTTERSILADCAHVSDQMIGSTDCEISPLHESEPSPDE